jgi:hypothetical protein
MKSNIGLTNESCQLLVGSLAEALGFFVVIFLTAATSTGSSKLVKMYDNCEVCK